MDRKINSPDLGSSIILSPSGEKRVKLSNTGGIILGNEVLDSDNYKLHRGSEGIQIVSGDDVTPEGFDSPNLAKLSASGVQVDAVDVTSMKIGSSSTLSENVKLRRSSEGTLEITSADSSETDGTSDPSLRGIVAQGSLVIGKSTNPAENIKLYRSGSEELDVMSENDFSSDGTYTGVNKKNLNFRASTIGADSSNDDNVKIYQNRAKELEFVSADTVISYGSSTQTGREGRAGINVKSTVIGSGSSESSNIKIRRSGDNTLEITRADDLTSDGVASSNKANVSALSLHLGNVTNGPDLPNNVKLHRGGDKQLEIVEGNDGTPDGTLSLKKVQVNVESVLIGNSTSSNTNNVRLHRGDDGELEVVDGDSTILDGTRSTLKKQINVESVLIGNSSTNNNNLKFFRGYDKELELINGDASLVDGTRSTDKAQLNVSKILIGNSSTHDNNAKLHRGGDKTLEVISGDSSVNDGNLALDNKIRLNARTLGVGNDTVSENDNIRLHRGGDKILEIVEGGDTTSDGTLSPNKADLNVNNLIIGKLAGNSSDVEKNIKLHRGEDYTLQVVKATDPTIDGTMSTDLSKLSYKFEDIGSVSPIGQESRPAWNAVTKKINYSDGQAWLEVGDNKNKEILENIGFKLTLDSNNLTIDLKQSDGSSDPTLDKPVKVSFRGLSETGSWVKRTVSSPLSLTIPADATLGTVDNVQHRIYIYLVDAGGNLELAVSQKYYDGSKLIETVAISSTSDKVEVIYGINNHTAPVDLVPIKCIGFFESTQTTAGYWAKDPDWVFTGDSGRRDLRQEIASATIDDVAAPGDVAVSNSNGTNQTTDSDGEEIVPNLQVAITSTGRPINIFGTAALPGTISRVKLGREDSTSNTARAWIYIYRYPQDSYPSSGTKLATIELELTDNNYDSIKVQTLPASSIHVLDTPNPGNYVYGVSVETDATNASGSTLDIDNVKLIAYEL